MSAIEFTLNGVTRRVDPAPGESLLEVLRNRCGIVSTKDGCAPQGQCGCCLAIVNGSPKTTCAVPAERAAGVVTDARTRPAATSRILANQSQTAGNSAKRSLSARTQRNRARTESAPRVSAIFSAIRLRTSAASEPGCSASVSRSPIASVNVPRSAAIASTKPSSADNS